MNGRNIALDLKYGNSMMRIMNIYAPNNPIERESFFQFTIGNILSQTCENIVGGAYNCTIDPRVDRGKYDEKVKYNILLGIISNVCNSDISICRHIAARWGELAPLVRRQGLCQQHSPVVWRIRRRDSLSWKCRGRIAPSPVKTLWRPCWAMVLILRQWECSPGDLNFKSFWRTGQRLTD